MPSEFVSSLLRNNPRMNVLTVGRIAAETKNKALAFRDASTRQR